MFTYDSHTCLQIMRIKPELELKIPELKERKQVRKNRKARNLLQRKRPAVNFPACYLCIFIIHAAEESQGFYGYPQPMHTQHSSCRVPCRGPISGQAQHKPRSIGEDARLSIVEFQTAMLK